jgi:hypothetical protein
MGLLRNPTGVNPLATKAILILFPIAHQLVTERPSVAQNSAQVTAVIPSQNPPEKFHLCQNP